jgi:hypothetical protein
MATDTIRRSVGQVRSGRVGLLLLVLAPAALGTEYTVRYEPAPADSQVRINGTSNLHDWEIAGTVIQGYVDVNETCRLNPRVQELPGLGPAMASVRTRAVIPVRSLKSGHSGMDHNTYAALKADQYPRIVYNLEQVSLQTPPRAGHQTATFDTVGRLTVAGVTRTVPMPVTVEAVTDEQVGVSGELTIKMTDFGVRPPTALFGMIRSGDQITIRFTWMLDRKTPIPSLPQYAAPSEQRQAITRMVLPYLQAENALAGNELSRAKEALAQVAKAADALAQIAAADLPQDAQHAWQQDTANLHTAAAQAGPAQSLQDVRLAFRRLSQAAIALVRDFGYMQLPGNHPLFSYGCSREDEQAKDKVWLQDTATADSPYEPTVRGHLSCGTLLAIYCPQDVSQGAEQGQSSGAPAGASTQRTQPGPAAEASLGRFFREMLLKTLSPDR